ncbi:MAG: hypothetical protein M1401_11360 [Chloroflexi bacterium]|nr:hypothetical protein [Chloroflexota bacterium]MCL5109444.1 hypothetical protein [Chloroflexota bacterium]
MASPRETGAGNVEYDLIYMLYHELQGNENLAQYERDANQSGDNEAAQLFRDLRESNKQTVDRARSLFAKRLGRQH